MRRPTRLLSDRLPASTASHMIESPAKVTDVLNSSRWPPSLLSSRRSASSLFVFLLISFLSAYVSTHFFVVVVFLVVFVCGRKLSSYGPCLRSAAVSAWDQTVYVCVCGAESGGIKTQS